MIYTARRTLCESGDADAWKHAFEREAVVDVDALSDKIVSYSLMEFNHLFSLQVGLIAPFLLKEHCNDDISDLNKLFFFANEIHAFNVTNYILSQ